MITIPIRPVARPSLGDVIRRSLQAYIADQRLSPGARLPSERELAAALEVGRPALREAMRELAALGVLTMRHGSGAYVASPQHPALTSITQLDSAERLKMLRQASAARSLVEVEVAGRAASLGVERLATAFATLDRVEMSGEAEKRRHRLDFTFEQSLSAAVGDPYLIELQRHAQRLFAEAWEASGVIPRPHEERHAQHLDIRDALIAGDVAEARRRMARHLELDVGLTAAPDRPQDKKSTEERHVDLDQAKPSGGGGRPRRAASGGGGSAGGDRT
ncbi:FadR/GntR family transcriptional regulator [Hansschlegelia zhihuaiae]|uniref:FadR family transcriptional regulator n=1 Tax=Hansschlegelia zhihuaiae TaxID=405005 RepID=A0A4Q0MGL5_9HYPH|nr:GntR family transcriptional regulator [Hansschlegelia zhihuaiae]RXF72687.1 FadR family transcriptional regulator [Hansschlegelia zhihuaiae]